MSDDRARSSRRPGSRGQQRRGGGGRFQQRGRRPQQGGGRRQDDEKIQRIIRNAQDLLHNSTEAVCLEELNAYERMRIHQYFDNKDDFETKTYRNGEEYLLWIFPVGQLKAYAQQMADEAVDSGEEFSFPPMSNFERFIVHDVLKDNENVETTSEGEGDERHVKIIPVKFGKKLKQIAKKFKLF